MLKELKFVQGAVAKKDFVPAITHFSIENGTVRAFNGTIALSSPIQCDLNVKPKAIPMVQAIARCEDTITLSMTPAGRLAIRSGSFKAFVDCVEEAPNHVQPEGEVVNFAGESLVAAMEAVFPFVGNDASRQWTNGVLLSGESVFATNNVCLVEYWVGVKFPHVVNIPRAAVVEMLRIREAPTHAQVSDQSITFHYGSGRWIRSQLYETAWPDLAKVLDVTSNPVPLPEKLFEGLDVVKPFVNKLGQVHLSEIGVSTCGSELEGASFEMDWPYGNALFSIEMLSLLNGVAKTADFSLYPNPCTFFGDRMRGAIIGMRL